LHIAEVVVGSPQPSNYRSVTCR